MVDFLARHNPREFGTEEETEAGDYLAGQMESLGYEVSFEDFDFVAEFSSFEVNGEARRTFLMTNAATGSGSGLLAYVGLGREQDMPAEGLAGRIALIKRGEILFQEKGENAAAAGAIAAVVFNHEPGLFGGRVEEVDIPMISLSGEDGEALLAQLESGEGLAADLTTALKTRQSRNIVADKPGTGDDARTLILGAHYDTHPDVVGANDNAAGISVLRMVAEHISGMDLPFDTRIVFFGAGEADLAGSDVYAEGMSEEELENTIAMVNFDVLGTGQKQQLVGDRELTEIAASAGRDLGIEFEVVSLEDDLLWSNHTEFSEVGLPVLAFIADNWQQTRPGEGVDDVKWINPAFLDRAERTAVEFVRRLAAQ